MKKLKEKAVKLNLTEEDVYQIVLQEKNLKLHKKEELQTIPLNFEGNSLETLRILKKIAKELKVSIDSVLSYMVKKYIDKFPTVKEKAPK
jgi:DNA polymerase III delta prime subunit